MCVGLGPPNGSVLFGLESHPARCPIPPVTTEKSSITIDLWPKSPVIHPFCLEIVQKGAKSAEKQCFWPVFSLFWPIFSQIPLNSVKFSKIPLKKDKFR